MTKRRRWLRRVFLGCAIMSVVFLVACGWVAQMARGQPEWRHIRKQPVDYGLTGTRVDFRSSAQLGVAGWWLPAWIATPPDDGAAIADPFPMVLRAAPMLAPAPTTATDHPRRCGDRTGRASVVLVHGIGANRSEMLPRAGFLVAAGYDVLAIDLRAHGDSQGAYPSPGYLEVAEVTAAIAEARRHTTCPVVLLGHSLGGVAVLHTASTGVDVAGTIADSAFISPFDMFDHLRARMRAQGESVWARMGVWFVGRRSLAGLFAFMMDVGGGPHIDARRGELAPVLPRIQTPVLFLTGVRDDIAPTANTHRMAALVAHGRVIELPAGHLTYDDSPGDYERAVLAFLAELLPSTPR